MTALDSPFLEAIVGWSHRVVRENFSFWKDEENLMKIMHFPHFKLIYKYTHIYLYAYVYMDVNIYVYVNMYVCSDSCVETTEKLAFLPQ